MRRVLVRSTGRILSCDSVLWVEYDGGGPDVVSTPYELCDAGGRFGGEGTELVLANVTRRCSLLAGCKSWSFVKADMEGDMGFLVLEIGRDEVSITEAAREW